MTAAAAPLLAFEPEDHTYRLHDATTPAAWGRLVPSVTQVIERAGLIGDTTWFTEESRQRGRIVHRAIMYDEREGLDPSSIDDRLVGYLDAYRAFKQAVDLGPCRLLETPLADPIRFVAGTVDQVRLLRGYLAVLDIKSGTQSAWWALQVAAYESLVRLALGCGPLKRYAVQLQKDGRFKLIEYQDRNDLRIFYSALAIVQWREANQ